MEKNEKLRVIITEEGVYHKEINDKEKILTNTPFNLLKYFIKNPGKHSIFEISAAGIVKSKNKRGKFSLGSNVSGYKGEINKKVFKNNEYIFCEKEEQTNSEASSKYGFKDIKVPGIELDIRLKEEIPDDILDARNRIAKYYWEKLKYYKLNSDQFDVVNTYIAPPILKNGEINISGEDKRHLIKAPNSYGKSTLLKIILISLNEYLGPNPNQEKKEKTENVRKCLNADKQYLALYINANDVGNIRDTEATQWLQQIALKDMVNIIDKEMFKNLLNYYCTKDSLVIIIDGLDEVKEKDKREKLKKKIPEIIKEYDEVRLVVATRPILEEQDNFFESYKLLKLDSLDSNESIIDEYVKHYIGAMDSDRDIIKKIILENRYFNKLVSTPFLMAHVIVLLKAGINDRSKCNFSVIKSAFEDNLLTRYDHDEDDWKIRSERMDVLKLYYQNIAYKMAQNGENTIINNPDSFNNIVKTINNQLKKIEYKRTDDIIGVGYEGSSNDIYTNNSLLITHGYIIKFISQEVAVPYFAACYLIKLFCNEYRLRNQDETDAINDENWKVFNELNLVCDDYILDTVIFMLVMILDRINISGMDISIDLQDLFLKQFSRYMEGDSCNEKVNRNLKFIFSAVLSDDVLGKNSFKKLLDGTIDKNIDELICD